MANHRATAALLLVASLLVAVALSGSNARPTVRPDKTVALHGAEVMRTGGNTTATVHGDANVPGHVGVAAAPAVVEPECDDEGDDDYEHGHPEKKQPGHSGDPYHAHDDEHDKPFDPDQEHDENDETFDPNHENDDPYEPESVEAAGLETELCSTCEKPKPEPKPEPEPVMTCNEVHAVGEGETCDSIVQCKGLGQDDFLRINPNLCCDKLFVGQWVCLDACGADD